MATVELSESNFRETLQSNNLVVLDFWASWCGPCRSFSPIYEEVSEKFPDVVFGKVNTEQEPQLAAYFGVRSIPTLVVIREGIVIDQTTGVIPAEKLEAAIKETKALDMDQVRKEVDADTK